MLFTVLVNTPMWSRVFVKRPGEGLSPRHRNGSAISSPVFSSGRMCQPRLRIYSTTRIRTPKPASPEVESLMKKFVSRSPRPLTLSKLLSFGRPLTYESILSSASYALSEIPRRLTRRIRALESLPFIVGTNPYVARTLEVHRESFEWLATYSEVRNLEENANFATHLEHLVQCHANDIPTMAKGCDSFQSHSYLT